jgi:hypothetical protein
MPKYKKGLKETFRPFCIAILYNQLNAWKTGSSGVLSLYRIFSAQQRVGHGS